MKTLKGVLDELGVNTDNLSDEEMAKLAESILAMYNAALEVGKHVSNIASNLLAIGNHASSIASYMRKNTEVEK